MTTEKKTHIEDVSISPAPVSGEPIMYIYIKGGFKMSLWLASDEELTKIEEEIAKYKATEEKRGRKLAAIKKIEEEFAEQD